MPGMQTGAAMHRVFSEKGPLDRMSFLDGFESIPRPVSTGDARLLVVCSETYKYIPVVLRRAGPIRAIDSDEYSAMPGPGNMPRPRRYVRSRTEPHPRHS